MAIVGLILLIFAAPSAQANSSSKALANLGPMDIMFAQSMIPHHQQAIDMSKLALKSSSNSEVKSLARSIIAAQIKEIAEMKLWLTSTKSSLTMEHDMGMTGMLTERQMSSLTALKGKAFDKAYLGGMIAHHSGALEMLSYLNGTTNAQAKKVAKSIKVGQSAEISLMKKLLIKIN